jgi:hypothetical protein
VRREANGKIDIGKVLASCVSFSIPVDASISIESQVETASFTV